MVVYEFVKVIVQPQLKVHKGRNRYTNAVTDKDVVILRLFQEAYDTDSRLREALRTDDRKYDEVFPDVVVFNSQPVFVENPDRYFFDKISGKFVAEGGRRIYKSDGFEVPMQGIYVPVLIDPLTPSKGYMICHPEIGTPLATLPEGKKQEAIALWTRYLSQIIDAELSSGRTGWINYAKALGIDCSIESSLSQLAEQELGVFYSQRTFNGNALPIRRVKISGILSKRNISMSFWPDTGSDELGVRKFGKIASFHCHQDQLESSVGYGMEERTSPLLYEIEHRIKRHTVKLLERQESGSSHVVRISLGDIDPIEIEKYLAIKQKLL